MPMAKLIRLRDELLREPELEDAPPEMNNTEAHAWLRGYNALLDKLKSVGSLSDLKDADWHLEPDEVGF